MSFRFSNHFNLRFGLNNLTDKQYFTKRPLFYPGPGVWSSDGRGFVFGIGLMEDVSYIIYNEPSFHIGFVMSWGYKF
jgi:hypothetical protein